MTAAAGTTRRRPHYVLALLYGYGNITQESIEGFLSHIKTQTMFKLLQFTRNAAIDMAADRVDAPCRNVEADSAAPWPRAPPLDHVKVVAVRAAGHES